MKSIMELISIFKNNIIKAATHKKGPKGIILFLSFLKDNKAIEIGRPIKEAIKMEIRDICQPKTRPKTNISLMSPSPIDSFLKIKLPTCFIKNIIPKEIRPLKMDRQRPSKPL